MVSHVSQPQYDRSRDLWTIRWRDEQGIRRAETALPTKEAAQEYRRNLLGQPATGGVHVPKRTRRTRPAAPPTAPADGVGTAGWWQGLHTYLAVELIKATTARDEAAVELLGKASRAFATLAQSNAQHHDLAAVEAELEKLRSWQAGLSSAATHGTRISAETQDRAIPGERLSPDDSVH